MNSVLPDSIKADIKNRLPDLPDLGSVTINWPEIKIEATFLMEASKTSSKMYLDSIITIEGGTGHLEIPDTNYFSKEN